MVAPALPSTGLCYVQKCNLDKGTTVVEGLTKIQVSLPSSPQHRWGIVPTKKFYFLPSMNFPSHESLTTLSPTLLFAITRELHFSVRQSLHPARSTLALLLTWWQKPSW